MQWGRQNPYSPIEAFVISSELLRFRQSFNPEHRPWRAGIFVEAHNVRYGLFRSTRLRLSREWIVREFRYLPEMIENDQITFDLFVSPRGRWRDEANWMLEIEYFL